MPHQQGESIQAPECRHTKGTQTRTQRPATAYDNEVEKRDHRNNHRQKYQQNDRQEYYRDGAHVSSLVAFR